MTQPFYCVAPDALLRQVSELWPSNPSAFASPWACVTFPQTNALLHRCDVERMLSMGLGHLPAESICIHPELFGQDSNATQEPPWFPPGVYQQVNSCALNPSPSATVDLRSQLCQFFPTKFAAALYEVESLFRRFSIEGYLIGGITRDLVLLGQQHPDLSDVDITIVGDAIAAAQVLAQHSRNFALAETYPEFGTAKVLYKDLLTFDLATTRQETYPQCGALPRVTERGVPLYVDVLRRDFSMNTLALSLNPLGLVVDYTSGVADLQQQQVRVLHGATFFEDPSRILRAYKFASRLQFQLAPQTLELMERFLRFAEQTPYGGGGARIRYALQEWLQLPSSPLKQKYFLTWLQQGGLRLLGKIPDSLLSRSTETILEWLSTAIGTWPGLMQQLEPLIDCTVEGEQERYWLVALCLLMGGISDKEVREHIEHRIELNRQERDCINDFLALWNEPAVQLWPEDLPINPLEIFHLFNGKASAACVAVLALAGKNTELIKAYITYEIQYKQSKPALDGRDLQALGVPKGPAIKQIMQELLREQLQGNIESRQDEIHFVEAWLSMHPELLPEAAPDAETIETSSEQSFSGWQLSDTGLAQESRPIPPQPPFFKEAP